MRLRILHFADLHLGIERYGQILPGGLNSRFEDFLSVLDEVVDFALKGDIDLILFCGDAYKDQKPDPTQQREFAKRIAKIARKIPVFLLIGNHDLPHALGKAATTEIFDALALENMVVARKPGIYPISTKRGLIQILALPWARRNALLEKEETKDLTIDQIYIKLQEKLTNIIRGLTLKLDPQTPAILAGHFSLDTAKPGTERTMEFREPILLQSNITNPIFSYIALGHIHNHQVLNRYPPIVYSGSLERLDFSDEGSEKGFYVAEIDKRETKFFFHPVKARHFLTLKFSIERGERDPMEVILRRISARAKEVEGAIVRVEIDLPSPEIKVDSKEIRRALSQAYFLASINIRITELKPLIRLTGVESLSPIDALRRYLELKKKYSGEYCNKVLKYGEKLIEEAKK